MSKKNLVVSINMIYRMIPMIRMTKLVRPKVKIQTVITKSTRHYSCSLLFLQSVKLLPISEVSKVSFVVGHEKGEERG